MQRRNMRFHFIQSVFTEFTENQDVTIQPIRHR